MVPKRAVRRRPTSAVEAKDPRDISAADWVSRGLIWFQGRYWEHEVDQAGKVLGVEFRVGAEGAQREDLLKYLSGQKEKVVQVHLCKRPCDRPTWAGHLIHLEDVNPYG